MNPTGIRALTALIVVLSTPVFSTPALGQVADEEIEALSVEHLKQVYLVCEREDVRGGLDSGSVAQCSIVYERLKQRAFEGDFERLFAWSREELKRERMAAR
jgi:hypothetical protein